MLRFVSSINFLQLHWNENLYTGTIGASCWMGGFFFLSVRNGNSEGMCVCIAVEGGWLSNCHAQPRVPP